MGHYLGSTGIDIASHRSPLSNTKVFQCSIDNRSFSFRVSCHHHFFIQKVVVGKRVSTSAPNLAALSSSIRCHYQPPEVSGGGRACGLQRGLQRDERQPRERAAGVEGN